MDTLCTLHLATEHDQRATEGITMRLRLQALLRPYWLLLIPVGLSFAAWVLPWEGARKGFEVAEPLTLRGVAFLVVWYGSLFAAAYLGYRRGAAGRPREHLDATPDDSYYRFFTILAAIGVAYSYLYVVLTDSKLFVGAISRLTFNELRQQLPYAAGIHTLRYATILAGGIALHRLFLKRELAKVHVLNLLLLFASAAIASRLSVVMAVLVAFGIAVRDRPGFSLRPRSVVLIVVVFFLAMTPLNYVRNGGFYEAVYKTGNPFVMNAYEIVSYLGAPFQGSLGMANHYPELERPTPGLALAGILRYALPDYAPVQFPEVAAVEFEYTGHIDIDPLLTTNSVLATLVSVVGLVAFPFMTVIAFLAALLAGHASRYRSYFFLVQVVVGYAFAEVWRVYLFNQGILHFLVLALLALPVWRVLRSRRGSYTEQTTSSTTEVKQ